VQAAGGQVHVGAVVEQRQRDGRGVRRHAEQTTQTPGPARRSAPISE
jgi:hypothetical protein